MSTATLFRIWTLSHENPEAAKEQLAELHAADAGSFTPDKSAVELPFEDDTSSIRNRVKDSPIAWSAR